MKGQVIVGIHKYTDAITPITEVSHRGLACNCICHDCKTALEAVINTRRRIHFRHSCKKQCKPTPETELHLLAKKIILDNRKIHIPGKGFTSYTEPVCEVWYNKLVPHATVMIDGIPFHIEIVVTNPISNDKFLKYKADNARVMVINLTDEDRQLDYSSLEDLVLNDFTNKNLLQFYDLSTKKSADSDSFLLRLGLFALITIIIRTVFSKSTKVKRRSEDHFI